MKRPCRIRRGLRLALVALGVGALPATAQQDTLRTPGFGPIRPGVDVLPIVARTAPGSSAGSPTAFGPNWGDGYVGVGFTHRARYMPSRGEWYEFEAADGAVSAGFGIGDARERVGLDVNVASYSTVKRGLGTRLGVSFKLHRLISNDWGVGLGWENAITHGNVDSDPSLFVVASRVWRENSWNPFPSITGTVGLGNGRFRSEPDVIADRETVNVFGSLGVQVWQPVSLIADWTGQDLFLGASVVPFQLPMVPRDLEDVSLVVTAGFADVTGSAGDGARFIVGVGLGFEWRELSL